MMSGRWEEAIASAAASISEATGAGSARAKDGWSVPGPAISMRSRGISMAAGRVRPERIADSDCPTASDTSPGLVTRMTSVSTAESAADWLRTS